MTSYPVYVQDGPWINPELHRDEIAAGLASCYSVSWLCDTCGERWADNMADHLCVTTEGCTGSLVGFAYYERKQREGEVISVAEIVGPS